MRNNLERDRGKYQRELVCTRSVGYPLCNTGRNTYVLSPRVVGLEGQLEAAVCVASGREELHVESGCLVHGILGDDADPGRLLSSRCWSNHFQFCQDTSPLSGATLRKKSCYCLRRSLQSDANGIPAPPKTRIRTMGMRQGCLTYSCSCKGQGADWAEFVTRISGGDWRLDPVGGKINGECTEYRL